MKKTGKHVLMAIAAASLAASAASGAAVVGSYGEVVKAIFNTEEDK